jgi:N-methylhydantoinase A
MAIRVATDIGGTFTDLVCLDEARGGLSFAKVLSTPGQPEKAVLNALSAARIDLAEVELMVHGSTVVINAITERKGVRVGLITTRGMRDVLEIARGNRPDIYNLRYRKPPPFVPRRLRLEVRERLDADGRVVEPLDEEDVREAARLLRTAGVEAVAVAFLHSYRNPVHEETAGEILRAELPGVYVTLSHQVSREWREYERTNTAVLNSYVGPIAARYLSNLDSRLAARGFEGRLFLMQSNGGVLPRSAAMAGPIRLVESGPAAGILGAQQLGQLIGLRNLLTLDIGGTTAKCSLIEDGEVRVTTSYHLERTTRWAGYPVQVPVVDVVEIGAGGGSIAWMDELGALRVGPRSAGAEPGPAAYGLGGTEPTVTDANLLLGRLGDELSLAGGIQLDRGRAERAFQPLARRLGLSVTDTAQGVLRLAHATMASALKIVSVERGRDPRDFALVVMGGGGPLHGPLLARELQIRTVVVPMAPGHFSAYGMLVSDLRRDFLTTHVCPLDARGESVLERAFLALEEEARSTLAADGFGDDAIVLERRADLRYRGQEHTVSVRVPAGRLDERAWETVRGRFHEAHETLYTFRLPSEIEVVNLHVVAFGRLPKAPLGTAVAAGEGARSALLAVRRVHFEGAGRVETPVYDRRRLGSGDVVEGPAIVVEDGATTALYPGMRATVGSFGQLIIDTGVEGR